MNEIHFAPRIEREFLTEQLLQLTAGKALGKLPDTFAGLSADSRVCQKNDLFIALKTETGDGHQHLNQAYAKGAAAALIEQQATTKIDGKPAIAVADTWQALSTLARHQRQKYPLPLCAISGSNGKTSTRQMLSAILKTSGKTLVPPGNWNNLLGLCLTLLQLDQTYNYIALELGMNHLGEIAKLTQLCQPQVGLLTNVGRVHLEFLGDLAGVAKAKQELFQNLGSKAVAVINLDDPLIAKMELPTTVKKFTFSLAKDADLRGELVSVAPQTHLKLKYKQSELELLLPFAGRLNGQNALAACACALALEIELSQLAAGLRQTALPPMRMQKEQWPDQINLLLDCYNSNPSSIEGALEEALSVSAARHAALLGDMLELGQHSIAAHRELGTFLANRKLAHCFLFGPLSKHTYQAAIEEGLPRTKISHAENAEQLAQHIAAWLTAGDLLLVKASRGMQLEKIVEQLRILRSQQTKPSGGA